MNRLVAAVAALFIALLLSSCTTVGPDPPADPASSAEGSLAGKHPEYCAHNADRACPKGSYKGPHVAPKQGSGHWNTQGAAVHGGPVGADGSTQNNLTQEFCARDQDPGCPRGSYVGPNSIRNPNGSASYVRCEGTVCTNPNHGGGDGAGQWNAQGGPENGGPAGANGSSGNNLTQEFCARNQDPGCPADSYVGDGAVKSPTGDNTYVSSVGN